MRPLKRTVFSPVIALRGKLVTGLVRPPGRMSCTVRRTVAGRLISQVIVVPSVACPRRRRATFRRWEAAKRRGVLRSRVMRSPKRFAGGVAPAPLPFVPPPGRSARRGGEPRKRRGVNRSRVMRGAGRFAGEVAPGLLSFVPAAGRSASRGGVAPGRFGGFAPGGFVPGAAGGVAPGAAGGVAPGAAGGVAAGGVRAPRPGTRGGAGGARAASGRPPAPPEPPERAPPRHGAPRRARAGD